MPIRFTALGAGTGTKQIKETDAPDTVDTPNGTFVPPQQTGSTGNIFNGAGHIDRGPAPTPPGDNPPPPPPPPPPGPPPPPTPPDDTMDKINGYFQDLLNQDQGNWNQFMGGYLRQADITSNRLGYSAGGGGYASLASGALGQAALDFGDRQRQTKLAMIDKLIGQDQREQEHGWAEKDNADAAEQHYTDLAVSLMGEFPNMSLGQIITGLKTGDFSSNDKIITDKDDPALTEPGGQHSNVPPATDVNSPYQKSYYESGARLENGVITIPKGFGNIPAGQIKESPHAVEDAKQACYEMGIDDPPTWMVNDLIMAASVYYQYSGGMIYGKGSMKKYLKQHGWDTWMADHGGQTTTDTTGGEG